MKKHAFLLVFFATAGNFSFCAYFSLGVENISAQLCAKIIPTKDTLWKVGLITNQSGIDQHGVRTVDKLRKIGCDVVYIFAPEHGLNGVLAERDVHDSVDKKTHIPVISLYGNGSGKMISVEHMNAVDMLVFDIQDSGMRHYTYISTLLQSMKIAAESKKPFVVLDRPNPLGGLMQGPLVEPDLLSFISIASIPLRHGMTIGELAWYFNTHVLEVPAQLHVVTMRGYDRTNGFKSDLLKQLSPNLQSLQSCYGYSFLGLLGEIEPFDVGVGTAMAFRCIALPVSLHVPVTTWKKLQALLLSYGIQSFLYHHINPKTNKQSKGLRLEFSDISTMRSFELFIDILLFFKQSGIAFSFSAAFDKAVGTKKVKEVIAGNVAKEQFFVDVNHALQEFTQRAQKSFFYSPFPMY